MHGHADLRLPAADGAARHSGQVHPRAAHGRGHHHHRLVAARAVHHPVHRQSRAQRGIEGARESVPQAPHGRDPQLLSPGAALVPGAPQVHRGRGHRWFAAADGVAGAGDRFQPVSQGRYAAVPDPGGIAERHLAGGNRPRAALRRGRAAQDARGEELVREPRPWQPADLLQPHPAQRRRQLRGSVRAAA